MTDHPIDLPSDVLGSFSTWIIALASLAILYKLYISRLPFPIVNAFSWDWANHKAYASYLHDAKTLIENGLNCHSGPISIRTPSGLRTVLPAAWTDWVKNNENLNHRTLISHDFFAQYPGFEANAVLHDPNNLVIDMIRTKLSQNTRLVPIISDSIVKALDELWSTNRDWKTLDWVPATTGLISRAAASIFVGPDVARNADWQDITISYVANFFTAAFKLKGWSTWTRPFVHWFIPEAQTCRKLVKRARQFMQAVVDGRRLEKNSGIKHFDAITWTEAASGGSSVDQGGVQLSLAMAALFTTSEMFRQTLLDICENDDLIAPLRAEAEEAFSSSGISAAALSKMALLESVMKESQRYKPLALIGLEREATKDTVLPNGTKLPCGSVVAVDASDMWSASVHNRPEKFDGYRFLRMREAGDERTAFVSSSKEHNTFGMGKHICPGRFFAATELKLCLAHVLLKYDVRLKDRCNLHPIQSGFYFMVNPAAQVEVRRRL